MKIGRSNGSGKYSIRYTNPTTGVVSSQSWYLDEQSKKQPISTRYREYLINNKWVKPHFAPHIRNGQRKNLNTKKGFMLNLLKHMKEGMKKRAERGREIQGVNEFIDNRRGRCDKFMAHFDEQVERYGYKCPITHIPFTMNVPYQIFDINNQVKTFSNVSPDRIFNHIDYTKQNLIFTSQLWNLTKQERTISEIMLVIKPEIIDRYKEIIIERFPDQKYALRDRGPWITVHGTGLKDG